MSTYFSKILILLPLCLLFGCRQDRSDKQIVGIAVIDVINNLGNYQAVPVSEIVSELEYIPLETGKNCLIGNISYFIATPSCFFVVSYEDTKPVSYAFGRDGRFIGEIGRVGQGPGEYQTVNGLSIDEKKQSLYITAHRTLLEYSYDGVFQQSINIPKNMIGSSLNQISFVRDNLFIGHAPNNSGNEMYNFLLFDKAGQIVKSFDNHVKIDRTKPRYFISEDAMQPFSLSDNIYVKENSNDTLYCINEQNELVPQFVFDLGKYVYSKQKRELVPNAVSGMEWWSGVIDVPDLLIPMVGIPNYLFFSITAHELPKNIPFPQRRVRPFVVPAGFQIIEHVSHRVVGIYDMAKQTTLLLDTDPVSRMSGLVNDLDGGLSFWPRYYTSDNELVDVCQAYEMKEILTEKYFAGHTIKNPQAHQNLKELLKNLKDDDNPVIVIANLK